MPSVPIPPMEQPGEDIPIANRNQYGPRRPSLRQEQQVTDLANRMKDIFGGASSSGVSDPTVEGTISA